MTFLPIVERELRIASRRGASYWSRVISATCALLFGGFIFVQAIDEPPATIGVAVFTTLSVFAMIYCLLAGINSTADCISSEKREGTLGLLFLTDLKGYDVVLGKLAAVSLRGLYGLMAIVPVLAIPFLMGGITNADLGRIALALGNIFFFSLSVGMIMSCLCTNARRSMALTFFFLVVLPIGLGILENAVPYVEHRPRLQYYMELVNPLVPLSLSAGPQRTSSVGPGMLWKSMLFTHALTWFLLFLSCLIAPRSWQEKGARKTRPAWAKGNGQEGAGADAPRSVFRRKLLDINAFFWLASRERQRVAYFWIALGVLFGLWIWGWRDNGREWFNFAQFWLCVGLTHSLFKFMVTSESGRRLAEDRKMGALELILSTPLTTLEIIRGQFLALRRMFLGPLIAILLFDGLNLAGCLRNWRAYDGEQGGLLVFAGTAMVFLVADSAVLSVCAIWGALSHGNPSRVTGAVLRNVICLPMIGMGLVLTAVQVSLMRNRSAEPGWSFWWLVYAGFGLAADFFFGLRAWRSLKTDFREVATHRFTKTGSFWGGIFRRSKPLVPAQPQN